MKMFAEHNVTQEIETFWLDVNKQQFFRGDVFTVQSVIEWDDVINIKVSYSRNINDSLIN